MTLLEIVNKFFFQWFFIRLVKFIDDDADKIVAWGFMGFMWPCTGWSSNYKYISSRPRFIQWKSM